MCLARARLDSGRWLTCALVVSACSAAPAPSEDAATPAALVELGTGETDFVELADADPVTVVAGPQGGWHVWVTARLRHVAIEGLRIDYAARLAEGATLGRTVRRLSARAVRREEDAWVHAGDFVKLAIAAPAEVLGRDAVLTVLVEDAAGRVARDERRVRLADLTEARADPP